MSLADAEHFVRDPEWTWYILFYFFLAGLSGGSYAIATLLRLSNRADEPAARIGYYLAFATMLGCPILLTLDLGQPLRFWHMLVNTTPDDMGLNFKYWSPMSVGAWALVAFSVFVTVSFFEVLVRDRKIRLSITDRLVRVLDGVLGKLWNIVGAVQACLRDPLGMQDVHALLRCLTQLLQRPELDRLGRAGLGAGGFHPALQPVVAERAFLRDLGVGVHLDHAVRARGDAVATTVADIRLDEHGVELRADNRPRRADLQAAGSLAVLADVRHHEPGLALADCYRLVRHVVDELHMPPVLGIEAAGVVEAVAEGGFVPRELVPFLAGDLAGFAADADARVGEEPVGLARCDLHQNPIKFGVILERPCSAA